VGALYGEGLSLIMEGACTSSPGPFAQPTESWAASISPWFKIVEATLFQGGEMRELRCD
jgi:hypothetical protein